VNVWEDNWIPGLRSLKPLARMPKATAVKVSELFISGTRVWDEKKVYNSFMTLEAAEVLKIRPSTCSTTDVLAWAYERNGVYSVRSAYHALKQDQMASAMAKGSETSSSNNSSFWSRIWRLNVPPKVRVFWWRVMHGSLHSKYELKRRHVAEECHCEMCADQEESLFHVLFACPIARRF